MENLILEGLSKRFGNEVAVDNLSLNIPQGAFVALLGPSGCGKTTILRLLAGFENPTGGSIHLGSRLLANAQTQCPPEQRDMAMVFQSYALWPHMTVAENVGYPLKVRGVPFAEANGAVRAALAQVEMASMAQKRPAELSGGQRQRVALARCLVAKPSVVLLDEPLANLDRNLRATMETTFREFHQQTGATLVYVTHDQSEAMSMADYIAVMRSGKLAQWATPEQLYQQPVDDWVAQFVGQGAVVHIAEVGHSGWLDGDVVMAAADSVQPKIRPVLLRPEHIQIDAGGLPATVKHCVYRGERYELTINMADGQGLMAWHHSALMPGQAVSVRLDKGWSLERAS